MLTLAHSHIPTNTVLHNKHYTAHTHTHVHTLHTLTFEPNRKVSVTVVVSCECMNITMYSRSGLADDCRKNL